jgi:predicted RNase H-like HicB family nuclease
MKARVIDWQVKGGKFLGFLNDFPCQWTQGEPLEDLREHLRDLPQIFFSETIPGIRHAAALEVA